MSTGETHFEVASAAPASGETGGAVGDGATLDLLVVGAGPTGIAIGAEARKAGLSVLLVDRGPLTAAIQAYPTYLEFFTTRDRLEIADIPFTIAEVKPTRRQALVYYRSVVERYQLPLALHEDVREVRRDESAGGGSFIVSSVSLSAPTAPSPRLRRARAVAVATGYFDGVKSLGVPGEELPWVQRRYIEPYPYFGQEVVIVGAGNTAAEAALDLWRNGARVTLVHRGAQVKAGVKYWLKPDIENRIAEGSIAARFNSVVRAFRPAGGATHGRGHGGDPLPLAPPHPPAPHAQPASLTPLTPLDIEIEGPAGLETLAADAAFVLIGYVPDAGFLRRCGVEVEPASLVPTFDHESCESNVPGLYIAGTIQAGRQIDRIFIENSREHAPRIVRHLAGRLAQRSA